jgi:hypothetical protein
MSFLAVSPTLLLSPTFVILNLFQDNALAPRVMLKQVQHDEVLSEGVML